MPPFVYGDPIQITLHIGEHLTLWTWDGANSFNLVAGEFEIEIGDNDIFYIVMIGDSVISEEYRILTCRMYIPQKPESFIINIPNFGERYFQKERD